MHAMLQDLLLFVAIMVPPTLFGLMLYFGLTIERKEEKERAASRRRMAHGGQKHPYHLQP
jgi:hypothetical protein